MVWTIIFAGLKGRPVRTWVSILMIALQVILLTVINWLVFLCFGILLIFLSMYSSITERTREIGILRSLGASKAFVAALVIKETLVISLIGIVIGFAVVLAVTHTVALDRIIWMTSVAISLVVSGIVGSLLAALRAAGRVPIEALAYE